MYPNPNGNQQPPIGFGAPGYPPQNQGYPPYPQQGQQPGYPIYPPQGAPYPPQGGQGQFPGAPYPPQGGQGQFPGAPYPPQGGQGQFPGAPYPPQGGPGQFPPAGASFGYPPQPQTSQYPDASPYPAQAAGYPPAYGQQQQPLTATHAGVGNFASPVGAVNTGTMQQQSDIPTIREGPCDPLADAQALRKAMKGIGTDEKAIINIVSKRTDQQRQSIAHAFKSSFGKDLIKDLKSELGGRLEEVVLALMTPRVDYLAQKLHSALSGLGTKERTLVDVLCTATNNEIRMINQRYHQLFNASLEKDLKGDTSGCFLRLLVSINTAGRSEEVVANASIAAQDAQNLLSAGEKKWGTDESMFNMILATRSYAQLRLMFHEYERLTGHAFERAIEREFSGDIEKGMLAVVKSAKNRPAYFAERLHQSLAGVGTKDDDLIFLLVTRAEIDLESIKQEYQKLYGKSLANDISGDTSGDYKKILLALVGM